MVSLNIADGIVIERDSVTLNGAGFAVQGTGNGTGIVLQNRRNVMVANLNVEHFGLGMYIYGGSNSSVVGNNVTENYQDGIKFYGWTEDCSVANNSIIGNAGQSISLRGNLMKSNMYRINITRNIILNNSGWCNIYPFRSIIAAHLRTRL